MNDDSVVMLLSSMTSTEHLDTELIEVLLRQIRVACCDYLKIGLSLVYSPISDNPDVLNGCTVRPEKLPNIDCFMVMAA